MGDPRPGRNQRRSFRGGSRGDEKGGSNSTSDHGQSDDGQSDHGQAGHGRTDHRAERQDEPVAEAPQADIPGVGEQPPYESRTDGRPRIRSRRLSPTSATFPSTGSRLTNPRRKLPLTPPSPRTVPFRKTAENPTERRCRQRRRRQADDLPARQPAAR